MIYGVNLDMRKVKKGFAYVKKTGLLLKDEAQYFASKHISFIESPYEKEKISPKQMLGRNIALTEAFYGDTIEDREKR